MTALLHPCFGFISQVRCINPPLALKSRCRLRRRGWRGWLSYRQLPAASAVTGLVVRYLAVFNVVSSLYHWCYCYFYHCTTRLWYLAHVDFLMMLVIYHGFTNYVFFYAKCFVRNDEIKLWNHMYTVLQWLRQNTNHSLCRQKTQHTSPWRRAMGLPIVRIWGKNDRVKAALHCMCNESQHIITPNMAPQVNPTENRWSEWVSD